MLSRKYQTTNLHMPLGNKLQGLNGLKAIAIIGVTFFHMLPNTLAGGYLGVCLFFLISGYLLAYTSNTKYEFKLIGYFYKRLKRIYPPLLIVCFATLGIYYFLLPDALSGIRPELTSIMLGYNNWWQINQNADYFTRLSNGSPFTHLWFLGIELQYFLIWPVIFILYRLLHKYLNSTLALGFVLLLAIITACIMPFMYHYNQDITRLYYGTDTRIYALLLGAFLGLLKSRNINYSPNGLLSGISIIIFALLFIATIWGYFFLEGDNPLLYKGGMLLATIGFGIMVMLATQTALPIGTVLDIKPLNWLGKHSYSIFLWQYPLLYLAEKLNLEATLGNSYLYNGLILLILLLLTLWTDSIVKYLPKLLTFNLYQHKLKKAALFSTTIITIFFMSFGIFGMATASDKKAEDIKALQAQLAANAAMLEAENAKAKAAEEAKLKAHVQNSLCNVSCIGDSVMLASAGSLRKSLPNAYIDAKVSRYVGGGLDVAKAMENKGQLGKVVLIGLGTNGPIYGDRYEKGTKDLITYLGPNRKIFWVNVYAPGLKWQNPNNEYLQKLAAEHPNITIIDWYGLISKHKEWLTGDGVHPNNQGIKEYVKLVHNTMEEYFTKEKTNL